MRTFKELKTVLEDYNTWGSLGSGNSALDDAEGTMYIERPEQLARINAYVTKFMDRDFIDVRSAFNHLRARLNISGIDFDLAPNGQSAIGEGHYEFTVTRQGGSFGTTPEHNLMTQGFYRDNGVPGMNFSLQADIVIAESGMYRVQAKIVPTEEEGAE